MNCIALTGKVVTPEDPKYDEARQEYNKAVNKYPCVIVYCYNSCDVANAIRWSRQEGAGIRIRSGGHNYEGYSTGNCKLVIDTSLMNGVTVNNDETVDVEAGVRLGPLYEKLYGYGYTFPGGTCPTVAISGLVLGGGIGLSSRYLGLTADSLIDAEVVDAQGNLLMASPCCNPELFWALKGAGGGNFGVVTKYKFRLQKVNKITLIQLEWENNLPARLEFLRKWQEWLPHLDRRMTGFGGIYKGGAWLNAFFYGEPEEAQAIIKPLLDIPGISLETINYVDFIDAVRTIGMTFSGREAFKSTGRFVQRQFSERELRALIDVMDKAPGNVSDSAISVYSLGGAVRDTGINDSAFFYREADYIMGASSSWENEQDAAIHQQWVAAAFSYLYTITCGSYINFPYNELPYYEYAYYNEHVRRLQYIKREYDPCNIFRFPQSIS